MNILGVDPFLINHGPIIKSIGICGSGTAYNDPRTGITIIFSKAKNNSITVHEGAHSYINQAGLFGVFLLLLTNALFVLNTRLNRITEKKDEELMNKLRSIINRIRKIRKILAANFYILHEIYALSLERVALVLDCAKHEINFDELIHGINKLDKSCFQSAFESHNNALMLIKELMKNFDTFSFVPILTLSHWILTLLPSNLFQIDPSTLINVNEDFLANILPNPLNLINSFLNTPPKFSVGNNIAGLWKEIEKRACDICNFKPTNLKGWENWDKRFIYLLPLDEEDRQFLFYLQSNVYSYDVLIGRLGQLRKLFQIDNKYKNNEVFEPIIFPPPVALVYNDDTLNLIIRKDINTPQGLYYMALKNIAVAMNEISLGEWDANEIFFCPAHYANFTESECQLGPKRCKTSKLIQYLINTMPVFQDKSKSQELICAKDEKANILSLSKSEGLVPVTTIPFGIIETQPLILAK